MYDAWLFVTMSGKRGRSTHRAKKPLYAALVPDEIFKGAHFERRFVTLFGSVWEKLAVVAAQEGLGYGKASHRMDGVIPQECLRRITEILNKLEHQNIEAKKRGESRIRPNWTNELAYVLKGKGALIPVSQALLLGGALPMQTAVTLAADKASIAAVSIHLLVRFHGNCESGVGASSPQGFVWRRAENRRH